MTRSAPPRFVPTLTEVVQQAPLQSSAEAGPATPLASSAEVMLQRVMQRVDLVLESRLREAIAQLVMEHTQALTPRLKEEVERVVRESLSQAFAQEAGPAKSPPEG